MTQKDATSGDQNNSPNENISINRYLIQNSAEGSLTIKPEVAKSNSVVFVLLFFGLGGLFLLYIGITDYLETDSSSTIILYSVFAVVFFVVCIWSLQNKFGKKMVWTFTPTKLVVSGHSSGTLFVQRNEVISVFVKRTVFVNQYQSERRLQYQLFLRVKLTKRRPDREVLLFEIEEEDSMTLLVGGINEVTASKAEQEALEIAQVIADHWKIPVSVEHFT